MKRMTMAILLLVASAAFLVGQVLPQEQESNLPEEYDPDEFPMWAQDLRRYEVVTVGSFPVTFFATSLVYDFSIYAANDFNPSYGMGTQRDSQDIAIIMGTAAATSLIIATIDLIINVNKRKKAENALNTEGSRDEP